MTNTEDLLSIHLRDKPKLFIDSLVMRGYYMSRSEFIRMAIDQKIEKIIDQMNDPFYQEFTPEESNIKQKNAKSISVRGF